MVLWNEEVFERVPEISELQRAVDGATSEEDIHGFLNNNRGLVAESLGYSRKKPTTLVLSKFPLGSEFVPDLVVLFWDSSLFKINLIELEPVNDPVITKVGTPSARLALAMKQTAEWKQWLEKGGWNLVLSMRDRIWEHAPDRLAEFFARHWVYNDTQYEFTIFIGRSSQWDSPKNKKINALRNMYASSVRIYSYDRLIRFAK